MAIIDYAYLVPAHCAHRHLSVVLAHYRCTKSTWPPLAPMHPSALRSPLSLTSSVPPTRDPSGLLHAGSELKEAAVVAPFVPTRERRQ
jgi:hypothetical protein